MARAYLAREYMICYCKFCDALLKLFAFLYELPGEHAFGTAGCIGLNLLSI